MLNRGSATILPCFELLFVLTRSPKPAEVTEACRPEIRYVMVESPAYFHAIRPASRRDAPIEVAVVLSCLLVVALCYGYFAQ